MELNFPARALLNSAAAMFATLRADNGSTFHRRLGILRQSVMPLSIALEDHPTLFDAVDITVDTLSRGRVLVGSEPQMVAP